MNVTLITGASGGIGEAAAHQFALKKHNLVLVARNEKKLNELCNLLKAKYKIEAQYIVADLEKPETANVIFEETAKRKLTVNVLINNAGRGSSGEFYKNALQSDLDMLQMNNSSLVALCRLFLPDMIQKKNGSIINVASLAAFFPSPYMAVYAASKMFVRSFTEALTEECRPYNVHVMLFNPGFTSTNFMNTTANNNEWGKVLTEGAYTQNSYQVAVEMIKAWETKKNFHVSGRVNALLVKTMALVPNSFIAKSFAKSKRKQMKL
ncbi:SDR family NAD(P)-dependent oxidoreductase [Fluviicola sp.]|uniref:SDR family NAD(P)-dependent oxidoreductase n=1 Tax=Fluviicola sp. TaxID=1917219 RepID=UPI003D27F6BC